MRLIGYIPINLCYSVKRYELCNIILCILCYRKGVLFHYWYYICELIVFLIGLINGEILLHRWLFDCSKSFWSGYALDLRVLLHLVNCLFYRSLSLSTSICIRLSLFFPLSPSLSIQMCISLFYIIIIIIISFILKYGFHLHNFANNLKPC